MSKKLKRPRDTNLLAKFVVDIATGEVEDVEADRNVDKNPYAIALGRLGGVKGCPARAGWGKREDG